MSSNTRIGGGGKDGKRIKDRLIAQAVFLARALIKFYD